MNWGALFESCHALAVERWQGKTVSMMVDAHRRANGHVYWDARVCVQGVPFDHAKVVASIRYPNFLTHPNAENPATAEEAITGLRQAMAAELWDIDREALPQPDEPLAFGGGR